MVLRTQDIRWGELCVTVKEPSAMDIFEEPNIWRKIADITWGKEVDYENLDLIQDIFLVSITRTVSASFEWPDRNAKAKEYKAAFELFKTLPGGFVRAWVEARRDLEQPPVGDPDLAPPDTLDEDQKKVTE